MDAITMLKEDHRTVEQLFKRFEKAGERAYAEKRKVADRVVEELAKHAAVEEQIFYPFAREAVPGAEDLVLESLEEHHIVKWVLSELDGMDATDERFDPKMTVLIENVRHHVQEEERDFFPKVRHEVDRHTLDRLGEAMAAAKKTAPTHPHPRSPDTPPANIAAGLTAGLVDRIGDTVGGVAQGSVTAVQDLIALIRGTQKRSPAPTGSKVARDSATAVRTGAASATEEAIASAARAKRTASSARAAARNTGRAARDGVADTVRAAKSGAKRTADSARVSARRTTSTPKRASTSGRRNARAGTRKTNGTSSRTAQRRTQGARAG
jgi:hemerythrin superfamily protein